MVPSQVTAHPTSVWEAVAKSAFGRVMVTLACLVQYYASVTKSVYVPMHKIVTEEAKTPVFHEKV